MKQLIADGFNLVADNWDSGLMVGLGTYELLARLIPTEKNRSILDLVIKIIGFIIKNRRKAQKIDELPANGLDTVNKVWVDRNKHIISGLLLLLSVGVFAQGNATFNSYRTIASDSLTIKTQVHGLELMYGEVGAFYYNRQSTPPKWRIYQDSAWMDMVGGGGGGGGFTLTDGSGTTADGTTLNWTGPITEPVDITGTDPVSISTNEIRFTSTDSVTVDGGSIRLGPTGTFTLAMPEDKLLEITGSSASGDISSMDMFGSQTTVIVQGANGNGTLDLLAGIATIAASDATSISTLTAQPTDVTILSHLQDDSQSSQATINPTFIGLSINPANPLFGSSIIMEGDYVELHANSNACVVGLHDTQFSASVSDVTHQLALQLSSTDLTLAGEANSTQLIQTPTVGTGTRANHLTIKAGNGSAGNVGGGNLTLSPGTKSGSGTQGYLIIQNLPTSSAGLPSGAVWSNAGVLTIVP